MLTDISKEQELCISCGLCCDGTLFEFARCKKGSSFDLNFKRLGFSFFSNEKYEEYDLFYLPCPTYDERKGCTIYSEKRPDTCENFFCKLIKDYQKNIISFESASKKIGNLKKLKILLENKLNSLNKFDKKMSFKEKIKKFNQSLPKEKKLSTNLEKEILLDLGKYHLLLKNFIEYKKI